MPWNGSGGFPRLYDWTTDRDADIRIRADRMDAEFDSIVTGLEKCLTCNGETLPTANLPMAGFKHTGVGEASAPTEYATYGQLLARTPSAFPDNETTVLRGDGEWAAVSLATAQTVGNLPVAKLNGGTGASDKTFWRGDGTWASTLAGPLTISPDPAALFGINVVIAQQAAGSSIHGAIIQGIGRSNDQITGLGVGVSTEASVFTVPNRHQIYIAGPSKGAGSTINEDHGLRIGGSLQGAINYGLRIDASMSGAANWSIHSYQNPNLLGGKTRLGGLGTGIPETYGVELLNDLTAASVALVRNIHVTGHTGFDFADESGVVRARLYYDNAANRSYWDSGDISLKGDVSIGNAGANATDSLTGFLYVPTCAGAPTGVPSAAYEGKVAIIFDTTNNKLYVYDGGWIATAALT